MTVTILFIVFVDSYRACSQAKIEVPGLDLSGGQKFFKLARVLMHVLQ